jgi:hypothetical protein
MVEHIQVNPTYSGPTILELSTVMADVQGTVEVKWQGSKEERAALQKFADRKFVLFVSDLPAMERAATTLGRALVFDNALLATALTSLTSRKAYNWRSFTEGIGTAVTRSLLTRLSAGALRKGVTPRIANIASECIIDNVNPVDADVLLRLKVLRGD